MYVDGSSSGSTCAATGNVGTGYLTNNKITISTDEAAGSGECPGGTVCPDNQFNGYLDDVRIYNRDLSSSDVTQLYNYSGVIIPTVTTQSVSSITKTTATGNGNITATGGANATYQGVVYDTASHSLPGNVAPGSSGYASVANTSGSFGTGAFTQAITGLSNGTTYYVRAYAQNSSGYAYGSEVSFTTAYTVTSKIW